MLKVKILYESNSVLMFCMRHIQVHDGQRHKDKRLQGNNQDMENCPSQLQDTTKQSKHSAGAIHNSYQDKDHLTCIHVAEQTQCQ